MILATILDFFEPAQAAGIAAVSWRAMPAGSFLIVSIGVSNDPGPAQDWITAYNAARVHLHSREQAVGYFAGLELVPPGLTEARHSQPLQPQLADGPRPADLLAGVDRRA